MNSFLTEEELSTQGLLSVGEDVKLSRKASLYAPEKIVIGDHVRIDDFCILSGNIQIGDYVHIAAYTAIYGGGAGVFIEDFANISSRVSIYSVNDDYTGASMTNPMIPENFRHVESSPVHIGRHVIIGSTSVILPGVTLCEGSAFGSFSLINHDAESWSLNVGIPFRKIRERSRDILVMERRFLEMEQKH
ncbi:acyltransferase [uncultured Selenomonas sp.]|uniref:acyltransferase n=1 Tax=uncultured Selenomonas sp. TaxID=159275 RepID=UPI0025E4878F|nr:acyltransferase [uncultured Selenomonas sp.]